MPLFTAHWSSGILGKATTAQVLYPDTGTSPFPTLYLLHGLSDDSTMWLRRTRLEVHAAALPLIIVMPDGYRSFYTDNHEGAAYARHIGEELPAFIERTFQARPARSARAIGGLSMGGYGALRVGLGYHNQFCSIHSHSGTLGWGKNGKFDQIAKSTGRGNDFAAELRRIFGPSPEGTDHHLLTLAKRAKKARRLPACGQPHVYRRTPDIEDPAFLQGTPRKPRMGLLGHPYPGSAGLPHEKPVETVRLGHFPRSVPRPHIRPGGIPGFLSERISGIPAFRKDQPGHRR